MASETLPQLRPLRLVEILDRAVRLYRQNFLKLIGIIAVVQIPATVLNLFFSLLSVSGLLFQPQNPEAPRRVNPFAILGPGYFAGIAGNCLLTVVVMILIQGVSMAAVTRAVTDSYFGHPIGFVDAYRKIFKYLPRLIGSMAVALVIAAILGVISIVVPCVGWFIVTGMWIFFMMAILYLIAPMIVLENQTALRAIRRAWELTRRRFWWVVGFLSVLYIFNLLLTAGPTFLFSIVFQAIFGNPLTSSNPALAYVLQTLAPALTSLVGGLIYMPLHMTCMMLMYFDLRVRTEGLDLTLQAQDASASLEDILAQVPSSEDTSLITGAEVGYFALLSLSLIALFVVLYAAVMVIFVGIAALGSGLV